MWMYFRPHAEPSSLELIYIFVFLYYLPYILGFYLGVVAAQKSMTYYFVMGALLLSSEIWIIYQLFDRYHFVGCMEDWQNGTAPSIFRPNPLTWALNGSMVLMIAYYAFVWWLFKKESKQKGYSEY